MPFADQPGAYWLLLGPTGCEFCRTAYDSEAAAQEIVQSSDNASTRAFVKDNVLTIPIWLIAWRNSRRYISNTPPTHGEKGKP